MYKNIPTTNTVRKKSWTPPFTIVSKPIKHLGINLIKEAKDLYNENFNLLDKRIEKDTGKMEKHCMFMDQ